MGQQARTSYCALHSFFLRRLYLPSILPNARQGYEEKPAGSGGQAAGNTKWWHVPDARIRELLGLPTTELRTEPEKAGVSALS